MREDNLLMLQDTLDILEKGSYQLQGKTVSLKLSRVQMEEVQVYLPRDVERICNAKDFMHVHVLGRCSYGCENKDSFTLARENAKLFSFFLQRKDAKPVLVLNLANPIHPGGGVRRGARAQEEDLCRKSSLLISLESVKAKVYYDYNRSLITNMGSDALMIHPQVEIIKDENGDLLPETAIVAVMTCAAPMLHNGLGGLTQEQYEKLMCDRITGMLKVAAYLGYSYLVLGAFGCGAFGNDARVVSDLFYKALKEFDFDGMRESDMFRSIDFAVLSRSEEMYNYNEFKRNFSNFYRDENQKEVDRAMERKKKTEIHLDAIRGCIFGGAAGDALGYPVEFLGEDRIFAQYGSQGITAYAKDPASGKALISDDTQMSLFTANGLLLGDTRGAMRGIQGEPRGYVVKAYKDWLKTQERSMWEVNRHDRFTDAGGYSWLLDVPELYSRRAPGNTCVSALQDGTEYEDYVKAKRNDSKGCGGIMRVAPLAVDYQPSNLKHLDMEGAQLAAITHGHSLGYMPAAVLVHIINRIIFPPQGKEMSLKEIILEARDTAVQIFDGDPHLRELVDIINRAVALSENEIINDLENIHQLGEGWVAEETLGISLYCALRHQDDFSAGIIAAVNHGGDSDSTGAVTGNILGAWLGYSGIADQWKKDLELSDVILEIADDLCHGCQMSEYSSYNDLEWISKYMQMHRPVRGRSVVFFWKENEDHGCFSNWFRRRFVIDDFEYFCVEQYMMAQRAKLFHDSEHYTAILRASEPWECRELGSSVRPYDAKAWDAVQYDVVKTAVKAKFEQNLDLKDKLIQTGDAILAEANPNDDVLGIGLDAVSASEAIFAQWPGKNLLGRILMEVRAEFSEEQKKPDTVVQMVLGDITKVSDVEAIVNAANKTLLGGGGVDGAIHRAAGPELLEECRKLHGCKTGEAKLTGAYQLPCKYVIHTVGPIWRGERFKEAELLGDCYRNALQVAVDHQIRSIAFPSISTGAYGYPVEEAAKIALHMVDQFIEEHPGELDLVEWVLFDMRTHDVYVQALNSLQASKTVHPGSAE